MIKVVLCESKIKMNIDKIVRCIDNHGNQQIICNYFVI